MPLLLRATGFLLIFTTIQFAWGSMHGGVVERVWIHDLIIVPAAWLVNVITPTLNAHAVDFTLAASGGGLNILNGCEGMDANFLLIAGFAVAPIAWRARVAGMVLGLPLIYIVNQARILVLFYAFRINHSWFDPLHSTVAPIFVVVAVLAYFYTWLGYAARIRTKAA